MSKWHGQYFCRRGRAINVGAAGQNARVTSQTQTARGSKAYCCGCKKEHCDSSDNDYSERLVSHFSLLKSLCNFLFPHGQCPLGCDFNHSARSMKLPSVTIRSPELNLPALDKNRYLSGPSRTGRIAKTLGSLVATKTTC